MSRRRIEAQKEPWWERDFLNLAHLGKRPPIEIDPSRFNSDKGTISASIDLCLKVNLQDILPSSKDVEWFEHVEDTYNYIRDIIYFLLEDILKIDSSMDSEKFNDLPERIQFVAAVPLFLDHLAEACRTNNARAAAYYALGLGHVLADIELGGFVQKRIDARKLGVDTAAERNRTARDERDARLERRLKIHLRNHSLQDAVKRLREEVRKKAQQKLTKEQKADRLEVRRANDRARKAVSSFIERRSEKTEAD